MRDHFSRHTPPYSPLGSYELLQIISAEIRQSFHTKSVFNTFAVIIGKGVFTEYDICASEQKKRIFFLDILIGTLEAVMPYANIACGRYCYFVS